MVTAGPNAAIYRPIVRDCLGLGDCLPEPQSWRPTWSLRDHSRNPPPEWVSYGTFPISITLAMHYFPFAYLLVAGALATIDSQMEEGALLSGASRMMILRRITFPVVAPAFAAAFVLTFGKPSASSHYHFCWAHRLSSIQSPQWSTQTSRSVSTQWLTY